MTQDVLAPGTIVGGTYEIEAFIGRGAQGEVYRAKHLRLPGLNVAIKVVTAKQNAATASIAFAVRREIAAKLAHPNVVQIVDYNAQPSGQPYLVMELLQVKSLHARLKRGPLKLESLTRIVREAGAALEMAHRAGVVHRDLKPENIFLVPVLDFGLSKFDDGAPEWIGAVARSELCAS